MDPEDLAGWVAKRLSNLPHPINWLGNRDHQLVLRAIVSVLPAWNSGRPNISKERRMACQMLAIFVPLCGGADHSGWKDNLNWLSQQLRSERQNSTTKE
jgi:hypothetical protein